jgi:SnoaL-like domain
VTADTEPAGPGVLAFAAIQAVTAIFVAADTHDWAGFRSRLADRVRLDWTSLNGGEPAELTGDQVTEAWRTLLSAFDATHHQLGNFLVDEIDDGQARLRFYGTATHVLAVPGQEGRWVLGARYDATLRHADDGWRTTALTLTAVWGEGNQNLLAVAAERAAGETAAGAG